MKVAAFGVSSEALRAVVTTVAPPSSSRCTMAAPIPREPPVTIARFPANSVVSSEVLVLNIRFTMTDSDKTPKTFWIDGSERRTTEAWAATEFGEPDVLATARRQFKETGRHGTSVDDLSRATGDDKGHGFNISPQQTPEWMAPTGR